MPESAVRDKTQGRAAGEQAEGLLIVAHGERGGAAENRLAYALAERLRASGRFGRVEVGFIRCEPSLEEAATRLAGKSLTVYPLFMSDGYYVRQAIPERLAIGEDGRDRQGRRVTIARPLGLDPKLPALITDSARQRAGQAGLKPEVARLLIVAHGSSKSSESADAARAVAGRVAGISGFASVEVAFLEEEPFLDGALEAVAGPAILFGLFAGDGMHAAEDLPAALERSGRTDIHLAPSLGTDPRLIERIVAGLIST